MSSAKECMECIGEHGLNMRWCGICRPIPKSSYPLNIQGCRGACCSCIQEHDEKTDVVPCQANKK